MEAWNELPQWAHIAAYVCIALWVIGLFIAITRKHTVYNRPSGGDPDREWSDGDDDDDKPEFPRASP